MSKPPLQSPLRARKAVHFHLSTLQSFDPSLPYSSSSSSRAKLSKRARIAGDERRPLLESTYSLRDNGDDEDDLGGQEVGLEPVQYDVVWCQWCLQHLSDKDLVSFLRRAKASLVTANAASPASTTPPSAVLDGAGIIVVKENVLRDEADGSEQVWYDDEDHSITRTSNAYERVFTDAGLDVVATQLQLGLPEELFPVRMWCLRQHAM